LDINLVGYAVWRALRQRVYTITETSKFIAVYTVLEMVQIAFKMADFRPFSFNHITMIVNHCGW